MKATLLITLWRSLQAGLVRILADNQVVTVLGMVVTGTCLWLALTHPLNEPLPFRSPSRLGPLFLDDFTGRRVSTLFIRFARITVAYSRSRRGMTARFGSYTEIVLKPLRGSRKGIVCDYLRIVDVFVTWGIACLVS